MNTHTHNGYTCTFDEQTHTYVCLDKHLKSITSIVSLFQKPFDSDGKILKKCAVKAGILPEILSKQWQDKGEASRLNGKDVHKFISSTFLGVSPIDETILSKYAQLSKVIEFINKFYDIVNIEQVIFSYEHGIAGTYDLLCRKKETGKLHLIDFKTGEKFIRWNKYEQLLFPFQRYNASHLAKYSIQLGMYKYIMKVEKYTDEDIIPVIVYITPKDFTFIDGLIIPESMIEKAIKMLPEKTQFSFPRTPL